MIVSKHKTMHVARIVQQLLLLPSLSQALTAFTNISQLKQTHAHIIVLGLSHHAFTAARLLACAAIPQQFANFSYAQTIFKHIHNPTLFMYNTMIRAFSQTPLQQPLLQCITFYVNMLRSGISPDKFTFPFLIQSCCVRSELVLGQQIHAHVVKFGFNCDVFVVNNTISLYSSCGELNYARQEFDESSNLVDVVSWTTLITAYANSGDIGAARHLFNQMPCRNVVSWNAMISNYAQAGEIEEAKKLFDEMPERDVASWSAMISGYSLCGMNKEALLLFKKMVCTRIVPNESSLVSAVSACAQLQALEEGVWLHDYIEEHNIEINVTLGTTIVDMYGKCGNIEKAFFVFNFMPEKNVVTWNSMIAGFAFNGCAKQALSIFWRMQMLGPPPNGSTFIALLSGCSHSGLVNEGCWIFNHMIQEYQIRPQLEHYGCMVDLLGRAGLVEESMRFVEKMSEEPHPGLWGALVGACKLHGEVELGKNLGMQLINLEPNHGGRYALLSNIFAVANRWDDMEIVGRLLEERKVLKTPGNSIFAM